MTNKISFRRTPCLLLAGLVAGVLVALVPFLLRIGRYHDVAVSAQERKTVEAAVVGSEVTGSAAIRQLADQIIAESKRTQERCELTIACKDLDTNKHVEGVRVALRESSGGSEVAKGATDAMGRLTFSGLAPGRYRAYGEHEFMMQLGEGEEVVLPGADLEMLMRGVLVARYEVVGGDILDVSPGARPPGLRAVPFGDAQPAFPRRGEFRFVSQPGAPASMPPLRVSVVDARRGRCEVLLPLLRLEDNPPPQVCYMEEFTAKAEPATIRIDAIDASGNTIDIGKVFVHAVDWNLRWYASASEPILVPSGIQYRFEPVEPPLVWRVEGGVVSAVAGATHIIKAIVPVECQQVQISLTKSGDARVMDSHLVRLFSEPGRASSGRPPRFVMHGPTWKGWFPFGMFTEIEVFDPQSGRAWSAAITPGTNAPLEITLELDDNKATKPKSRNY